MEEQTTEQELSLRDYVNVLIRRRASVVITFLAVCALGAGYTYFSRPMYRASFRIVVRNEKSARRGIDLPLEELFNINSSRDVQTQMQVLQGSKLRESVLEAAKLEAGAARLSVQQIGDTDVLELSVDSRNRSHAVRFAAALPDVYAAYVKDSRSSAVRGALKFVDDRLDEEQGNLSMAEAALTQFRRDARVTDTGAESRRSVEQYAQLETQVNQAEANLAGREAELTDLVKARNNMPDIIEKPVTATNTMERNLLQDRIGALENTRAGLLIDYKPTHPRVLAVDAQINDMKDRLARLPEMVTSMTREPNPALRELDEKIATLRGSIASARVTRSLLQMQARAARQGMSRVAALEIAEAPLQRDVETSREMRTMLTRYQQELSLRDKSIDNPIELVSSPPDNAIQVAPRPLVNMALAILMGLILGLGIAALQEYFDDRINAGEDMRRLLGAPVLAAVSMILEPESRLIHGKHRDSQLIETFRMLRTGVRFATVDAPASSLLVTSAFPGEGKSLVATNLAVSLALSGIKVILIDTDLRRPSLHDKFDISREPGLTTVLIGHCTIEEALQDVGVPGLKVMPTGPLPPNPAELLGSHAMRQVHADLLKMADVVLFDSPPVMVAVDALVLANECNGVVAVSDLERARKSEVHRLSEMLRQVNA
ncbi:MAG: polysaccharide biosynthesis tyrosine autokinase, partial [Armatimonadetes bacterium]|nr:polysaccharide biosynthesis tyrosine autokinase [Armatimonadota bacterium]